MTYPLSNALVLALLLISWTKMTTHVSKCEKPILLISNIVKIFTLSSTTNVTVVLTGTESDWDYIVIQDPPKKSGSYGRFIHLSPDADKVDVVSNSDYHSKTLISA